MDPFKFHTTTLIQNSDEKSEVPIQTCRRICNFYGKFLNIHQRLSGKKKKKKL